MAILESRERVGAPVATLTLVLDVQRLRPEISDYGEAATPTNLAGVLGGFDVLWVAAQYAAASRARWSLADVVAALAKSTQTGSYGNDASDLLWAARRTWLRAHDLGHSDPPAVDANPYIGHLFDDDVSVEVSPVRCTQLRFGSPMLMVLELAWKVFAAGGTGMAFVRAVEYWCNSPKRVRTEAARLDAQAAQYRADEMEADARARGLLDGEQKLAMTVDFDPAMEEGTLLLPDEDLPGDPTG